MKRNLSVKNIIISTVLSTVLIGCGSTDDNNKGGTQLQTKTIKGKAVDGYLQYATVCLDISKDGYCQEAEPKTQTLKNGSFSLDISPEIQKDAAFNEAMLLVYGGKDVDTGAGFKGKLLAPADTEIINVSPITTLVAKVVQKELKSGTKLTKEQMKAKIDASKEKVAKVFGLEVADLVKDPVAEKANTPKLIKEALKIQKAVEAISIDGNNDALEKMYERLAENLENIDAEKGLDALFEESLKNEATLLKKAKDISANIDTSFEKFDGDLEKIAHVTKEDLRNVKADKLIKREDSDPLFQVGVDWDSAYIEGALKDIGIETPSTEQIKKIKDSITSDIKPGMLEDIKEDLKGSDDEILKDIYKEVKKDEAEKEAKVEQEKAMKDGKIAKFEKGMTLYGYNYGYYSSYNGDGYIYNYSYSYDQIHFGEDDKILIKEFELKDGVFVEESDTDDTSNRKEYILKNGAWEVDNDEEGVHPYTLNEEGVLTLDQYNMQVMILNQKDISNKEIYIDGIDKFITMPSGSQESYLGFKELEDSYHLYVTAGDYTTLSEYVAAQCTTGRYVNTNGSPCDANSRTGKIRTYALAAYSTEKELKSDEWAIRTVNSVEILLEGNKWSDNEEIYAVVNDQLMRGDIDRKGYRDSPEPSYNAVAIEAIKKAVIEAEPQGELGQL